MFRKIHKRMKGEKGFTLIELLVVIIIIAILAAIAIPTFLGQRQKAQDAAAKSLVRNAMTAIESTYVDTQSFATMTTAMLDAVEPSIDWPAIAAAAVGNAAAAAASPTGAANISAVSVGVDTANIYGVGSLSASGHVFGVRVDKNVGNTYYKGNAAPGAALAVGVAW